jgi:diguanylate cyclase (GGDEF)-like protein
LQHLAQTLTCSSRANDVVGRYAGDEFVVLLPNIDVEIARVLVGRLSADLRAQGLHCSLGAAIFPEDAIDAEGLLCAADRALYATKAAGKNGFSFA